MKVGPTDIPADGDALAAARRATGPAGTGPGAAGATAIEGFGVRFGTLLANHLAPPKPVSGAARGMAGRSVIDAALAAGGETVATTEGRATAGLGAADGHRPIGAAAATGDALDPDGGRSDDPRRQRERPRPPAAQGVAAPTEEVFVPGLDAVRGLDRAGAPPVPVTVESAPAVALVPGEPVEDAGDAPRQAVPAGRYARIQAAIMAETIRPAVDEARGARREEPRALSDLTVTFGAGVGKGDLRVSRKGDDIVIGFASGGEAMVIRGGAVHGGPTLVFADGRKVPGDALLYEFVDTLDARAPDNGMPAGGLLA